MTQEREALEREAFEKWFASVGSPHSPWLAWQARARLGSEPTPQGEPVRWRHVKSGGVYEMLVEQALLERDQTEVSVYRSLTDGNVWVRPLAEFHDGRFVRMSATPQVDAPTDRAPCVHEWKVTSQRMLGMWLKCEKCGASKEETWD